MKTLNKVSFFVFTLLVLGFSSSLFAQSAAPTVEDEIIALTYKLWKAEDEKDTATRNKYTADDYIWRRQKLCMMGQVETSDSCRSLLNQNELALLDAALAQSGTQGEFVRDNLWRVDYRCRPPTMEESITDVHYLGTMLHPDRPCGLWPVWFRILCEEFDRDSLLHNVVLTGALGTGKTTVMVVILLYRICHLLLLKRPAEMFEQGAGATLYFVIISITREAAQHTAFPLAASLMAASPFFQEAARSVTDKAPSGGDIELAGADNNGTLTSLHLISGSKTQHLIGRNIIGIGFDEGNYRLEQDQTPQPLDCMKSCAIACSAG